MSEKIIDITDNLRDMTGRLAKQGACVDGCYQCLRCSAGCPMLPFMDHPPNQLIRMLQFGMDKEALASNTYWMCASCQTCTTRCPNNIEIAHLMDLLRQEADKLGVTCPVPEVSKFHKAFLKEIRRGRVHELGLIGRYKIVTGRFTDDMALGIAMFRRGRIKLLPERFGSMPEIKELIRLAEEGETSWS